MWLEDTRELERQVREMMANQVLPPEVVGFDVEFGTHWHGDPAVRIDLYVPGDAPANWDKALELSSARTDTWLKLKHLMPHRLSSVRVSRPPYELSRSPPRGDA